MENLALRLTLTSAVGTVDATQLVQSVQWGGGYNQVSRTLDFSLLSSPRDKNIPVLRCELGDCVRLYLGDALLFEGFVFSRQKDTGSDTAEIGCFDRGIYLKRNEASYQFKNMTPEAITRRICTDFGVEVGALAATEKPVTRSFSGASLYQIIQSAYTLASEATGEKYMLRFHGAMLEVVAKKRGADTPVLRAGSNLVNATVTESAENVVNQVVIYDDKDVRAGVQTDENSVKLYGLMQAYLKKSKDTDNISKAKQLLADSTPSQKISVKNVGDPALIAGSCVVMQEPVTGLYGLFWIDSDTHTWKNGLYQNKLVLNFKNMMDEQEAGSPPKS